MYDLKDQMKSFNREGLTDMSTNDANTSEQDSHDGENDPSLLALPHEKKKKRGRIVLARYLIRPSYHRAS
jgi:hypothetical protein